MPVTDTYIDKEAMINDEIDRLRHAATQSLLTRQDVIVVTSVSCIYGLGEPKAYEQTVLRFEVGADFNRREILRRLVEMQFTRATADLARGTFRLRGDVLEIMPANEKIIYRLELENEKIGAVVLTDPVTRKIKSREKDAWIFPAKHFVTSLPERERALREIKKNWTSD